MNQSDYYEDDLLSCALNQPSFKPENCSTERQRHLLKANALRVHKPEIIMNTVEAWSKDFNGKLLRNLRHGDIRQFRSAARPLVFGGTYPIDEPILHKRYQDTTRKTDYAAYFEPDSFPIDEPIDYPIKNFANWNCDNVKRRIVQSSEFRRDVDLSDTDLTDSEDCSHVKDE